MNSASKQANVQIKLMKAIKTQFLQLVLLVMIYSILHKVQLVLLVIIYSVLHKVQLKSFNQVISK